MISFNTLKESLLNYTNNFSLKINDNLKRIIGIGLYKSINMGEDEYMKVFFHDNSFILVLINEEEIYYDPDPIGEIKDIKDEEIGMHNEVTFNYKKYKIVNKDDYQYVIRLIAGDIKITEGEVRFTDYFPVDGSKEFLSLGNYMINGKRGDLNPKLIEVEDIEIVQ
jgi:hypothetical protein